MSAKLTFFIVGSVCPNPKFELNLYCGKKRQQRKLVDNIINRSKTVTELIATYHPTTQDAHFKFYTHNMVN